MCDLKPSINFPRRDEKDNVKERNPILDSRLKFKTEKKIGEYIFVSHTHTIQLICSQGDNNREQKSVTEYLC